MSPPVLDASGALDAVQRYGDNPSAFLALNSGNSYFAAPDLNGVITYRPAGSHLIQFAGPFSPAAHSPELLRRFLGFAAEQRRRVVAIQLQREDAAEYAEHGFTVNQVGASYALDLSAFTLRGTRFMRLRNKISRAMRSGLEVEEVEAGMAADRGAPDQTLADELDRVDKEWLRDKGRHAKSLRFLVGERTGPVQHRRRLFAGRIDGTIAGYITYSPAFGARPGWLHDLCRRRADVPPGVMEAINVSAIERFREENAGWLHFGFTPFTGLDPAHEVDGHSPLVRRIVRFLAERGDVVYPARTQLAYKEKWGPSVVLPEYIAFYGRPRVGAVWRLLRATGAV